VGLDAGATMRASAISLTRRSAWMSTCVVSMASASSQSGSRIDPEVASDVMEGSEWLYRRTHDAVQPRGEADAQLAGMAAALTGTY
jgi:hypothetical protein